MASKNGLNLDNIPTDLVTLTLEVTDGKNKDLATVDISVKDVNDREPTFERSAYEVSVPENAEPGTRVETVLATDADFGPNAELTYRIARGAFDDFTIDPTTGLVTVSGRLDFDRRAEYVMEVVAADGGSPSLSGTTTLTVTLMNKNDKVGL